MTYGYFKFGKYDPQKKEEVTTEPKTRKKKVLKRYASMMAARTKKVIKEIKEKGAYNER